MEELQCFDCKKTLQPGDEYMTYCNVSLVKCKDCHIKNPDGLFQECEIFSRVCGYIRPIKQFNLGKAQEHKDKKYYTNGKKQ